MSALAGSLEGYIALRRASGYRPEPARKLLEGFVTYLEARGEATVSVDAALAWATDPAKSPNSCAGRLTAVRGFARYLRSFDDAHQVPPRSLLPLGGQRRVPYLFSPAEVVALMGAARRLVPRPFGAAMETLIGLLATTGLRPGEAYALGRGDVDFEAPAVAVGAYKPGGCRILPLHPSAAEALRSYASERDKALPGSAKFFAFCGERPGATFSHLLEHAGVAAPPGRRLPRLYDLRHSFAVSTLVTWYGQGADVRPRLAVLSAYMGHKKPKETYWYLQAAPELMALAARRLELSLGEAP
jgi:integrase/recombinase XerD